MSGSLFIETQCISICYLLPDLGRRVTSGEFIFLRTAYFLWDHSGYSIG